MKTKLQFLNFTVFTTKFVLTLFLFSSTLLSEKSFAQCPAAGDQITYGINQWIGYVYASVNTSNPPTNAFTTTYRGYITQPEVFSQNLANGSLSGPNLCGTYADQFSIRYRMRKNFPAGNYTFLVGGDDGYRLSVNGGSSYIITNWNDHGYTTSTTTVFLSGSVDLVLEYYEQGGISNVSFAYGDCSNPSSQPDSLAGPSNVCLGNSVTLTATGGTHAFGAIYEWGTGATVGSNIIAGQNEQSLTVSPTATTTYWVRRVDTACGIATAGRTRTVTVGTSSTAPTAITGNTNICVGSATTLTATGGTNGSNSAFQWGTGSTIGSNIIAGETGATLTVSPTTTSTYWVRRRDSGTCAGPTSGITTTVTINVPQGDQVSYGNNSWIGYVYSYSDTAGNPPSNVFETYRGYTTQPIAFDVDLGSGTISGANICGSYGDYFGVRLKLQHNITPGYYTFTVGGDDGYRLSIDGGATYILNNWSDHGYTTSTTASIFLSGPQNFVLEYYEKGGSSRLSFNYTACTNFSTAPTAIIGNTNICASSGGTTLTATGGNHGENATYQWGTGSTVGSNIIGGQTSASIYVDPATTTTYWVRRIGGTCNITTAGLTTTVNITSRSTQPTSISGGNVTICNGNSVTLTANGGTSGTNGTFQWGTGNTPGANIIAGATTNTLTVSPSSTTVYWVRRADGAPCNVTTNALSTTITVQTVSTAPTSISGNTNLCSTDGGTNLTAIGGTTGSNGTFQWGTGSVIGANIIGGQTNSTLYVNPTSTTTYWVRRQDASPCNSFTNGVTLTVNVTVRSTQPSSISGGNITVCEGSTFTLTATGGTMGGNAIYEWGTGYSAGINTIAGQNSATLTTTAATTGGYWVRRVDGNPCNVSTGHTTTTITVNSSSTAPTGISGVTSLCSGTGGTTLTATGGTTGSNGRFQWGTGSIVGSNILSGQNNASLYINPTTTTTYWVRRQDLTPCNSVTSGIVVTVTVETAPTQPTTISSTSTICLGQLVTLTASGGTMGTNSVFQWGTGATVGNNIITNENGNTLTVSPTSTTTYWVRRVSNGTCGTITNGVTRTITVNSPATAPTSITGGGSQACPGTSRTLTATGGSGSVFEWGTGVVGTNIIAGQTGASISVNPNQTTTYWVRRVLSSPCSGFTDAVSTTVSIIGITGDYTIFGDQVWNVYGFSNGDIDLTNPNYMGYYVDNRINLNTQTGTNGWNINNSPSSSTGWNGCTVPNDNFTLSAKRKGFPCGNYTITLPDWDDQVRVFINGNLVFSCDSWYAANACVGNVGNFYLDSESTIEVRIREFGGLANVSMSLVKTSIEPTAPTGINGITAICSSSSTTLTATGGSDGTSSLYQWGKGSTVGENILIGETSSSVTVDPTSTTTYWVRRVDILCNTFTSAAFVTVTVFEETVAGTLSSGETIICKSKLPNAISLNGNIGSVVKWQKASNSSFTVNVSDINSTNTTLTGTEIGYLTANTYIRAVVQNETCETKYTIPVVIEIPDAIVYNGTWQGVPDETKSVIIQSNLTLTQPLHVCSCEVAGTAILTVNSGVTLTVEGDVTVSNSAELVIRDTGSLLQIENNAVNTGKITVYRKTTPMKPADYTYWSSPVSDWRLNQLSPNTPSNRFYSYSPTIANWVVHTGGNEIMQASKGYIVRAPNGWSLTNATNGIYEGTFKGTANNGIINVPVIKGAHTSNLIGNPYPSAIDIDEFILNPANAAIFDGTIYLWTHNTAISSSIPGNYVYNYTSDDYASYNLTGGVKSASTAITGGVEPSGKIASGQAFFIDVKSSLPNGNYTGVFNNQMRIADENNQFFRTELPKSTEAVEKNRLWLNIFNSGGAYHETLLGYVQGATNELDYGYDGKFINAGNFVSIYSILNTDKLSIQARALPFNQQEVIPIGYRSSITGQMGISIEKKDGFFMNQTVYLHDYELGITHNLSEGAYWFTAQQGTFDTRFELRFVDGTLSFDQPINQSSNVQIVGQNNVLEIKSNTTSIDSVYIYDVTGKLLRTEKEIQSNQYLSKPLYIANQVVIVKVVLENDQIITQKIAF